MKTSYSIIHHLLSGLVLIAIYTISFFNPTNSLAINETDSLLHILNSENLNDSEQSILYSEIAKAYLKTNLDSARFYANRGLNLAGVSGNIDYSIKNLIYLADVALKHDSLISARNTYLQAAELTDKATDIHAILSVWIMLGYVNDLLDNYEKSLNYYFKGLHVADSLGMKNFSSRFNNNIASIYSNTKNYSKAINYYLTAAAIFKGMNEESFYANTLLNIGGTYYDLDMPDSAWFYLNKSKDINEKLNNHYGLLNYYYKIGEIEFNTGNYKKALANIQLQLKEIAELDKTFFGSNAYNMTGALLFRGKIYFHLNEYQKAIESYQKAMHLAKKSSFLKYIASAGEGLSKVFEKTGNLDSALVYYKLFQKYNDSLKRDESIKKITELEMDFKFQKERKLIQLEKERIESRQKVKKLIYLSIIGASISGLLLFLLLYVRQKDKHKQSRLKEQNLQLEKENLAKELEFKNKELTTNVMYLLKKNEFISGISNKLKVVDCNTNIVQPKVIVDIINELDKNTSKEVWSEFETRFQDIYGDFYKQLNDRFPGLTPNELKLCAFLKLNMSTKEISSITFQSTETLKTARHRLRKKLGLTREDNLVVFLNQV